MLSIINLVKFLDFKILNEKHYKYIINIQLPSVPATTIVKLGWFWPTFLFFSDTNCTKVVISHSKIQIDKSFNITWEQLQNQGHISADNMTSIGRIPSKNYLDTLIVEIDYILSFTISRSRSTDELFIKLEKLYMFWNSDYMYTYLLSNIKQFNLPIENIILFF